ncbi:MAG: PP2C family protein-serine/threonine phosphatase [Myxococcales bacterium]
MTGLLPEFAFEMAALSDVGTARDHNEDFCACASEAGLVAVADGVSGNLGGETASRMAVEATLRVFREQAGSLGPARRIARAAQQANIEVHELSLFVPELRGMSTTLTAAVIEEGHLYAVHVGDSRLYLMRDGALSQLTKDHTAAAERVRLGVIGDPSSVLTRSLGRDLICSLDRFSMPLLQGDVLVLCSDGLHRVLAEAEIVTLARGAAAAEACAALIETANRRGTPDNLTAAVVRMTGPISPRPRVPGLGERFRQLVGMNR